MSSSTSRDMGMLEKIDLACMLMILMINSTQWKEEKGMTGEMAWVFSLVSWIVLLSRFIYNRYLKALISSDDKSEKRLVLTWNHFYGYACVQALGVMLTCGLWINSYEYNKVFALGILHGGSFLGLIVFLTFGKSKFEKNWRRTVQSPQFQQAMALQSSQIGPLIREFGLGDKATEAATNGDMAAFVKALQDEKKQDKP